MVLLKKLLSSFAQVETEHKIGGKVEEIDVCFFPNPVKKNNFTSLGLLQRLAANGAAFEIFHDQVSDDEIRSSMSKLFHLHAELNRQSQLEKQQEIDESSLPQLWILTPTIAAATLEGFGAIEDVGNYGKGVYLMAPGYKTGFVVIHQLPQTADTLWLRVLGKDEVQKSAIEEINQLDVNSPHRQKVMELFSALQKALEAKKNCQESDI